MTIEEEVDDFLAHHGVRGQKWGIRNAKRKQENLDRFSRIARGEGTRDDHRRTALNKSERAKKTAAREVRRLSRPSRKERKIEAQARYHANSQVNAKLAKAFVVKASKNPSMTVLLNGRQVITGKQFVEHMMAGGLMDIRTTGELKF